MDASNYTDRHAARLTSEMRRSIDLLFTEDILKNILDRGDPRKD
jgi:hypothetical protein